MINPMLATLIENPFNDEDWVFEIKWDGFRAIAEVNNGAVKLYSRNHQSFLTRFAPIATALKKLKFQAIFDGEIVVLDEKGRSRFQLMQNYQRSPSIHLYYYVFDLLEYQGKDLRQRPLTERKAILKKLLKSKKSPIKFSDDIDTQGIKFFKFAVKHDLEGIIGKRKESHYLEGQRSREWVKIKKTHRQEVVICGFTEPKGGRKNLGSLITGVYKNKKLVYTGHVGGGFTEKTLAEVKKKLLPLVQKKSPFETAPKTNTSVTWVKPKLLCEVEFSEWTDEGQMRHPIFLGLRTDKPAKKVIYETPIKQSR